MNPATRILAVNPNTSKTVTDAFVAEARRLAPPDVVVDGVTGAFGATIVSYEAENVIAGHAALQLIADHAAGYDAVILAISFDTALIAARETLDVPVVGLAHATCAAARAGGRRFGVIGFGPVSLPLYARTVHGHGFRPVGFEAVEFGSTEDYFTPMSKDREVLQAVDRLVAAGAEAVAIIGTAVVGIAERLGPEASAPLYDGVEAMHAAVAAVHADAAQRPPVRPVGDSIGLSPALTELIGGNGPSRKPG